MDLSQMKPIQTPEQLEKEAKRLAAIQYLKDTDWHLLTKAEVGIEVPAEIMEKRNAARETIYGPH